MTRRAIGLLRGPALCLALLSCSGGGPGPGAPGQVALGFAAAGPQLELPARSRADLPTLHPVPGPWVEVDRKGGAVQLEAPLPVRLRTLFLHRPPDDMALLRANPGEGELSELRHGRAPRPGNWTFTEDRLRIWQPADAPLPGPDALQLRYSPAAAREQALQLGPSGLSPADFALRSMQLGTTTRRGLLLPAPAEARWTVVVPQDGVLSLSPALMPPESAPAGAGSDGARLIVELVDAAGGIDELLRVELRPHAAAEALAAPLRHSLRDRGGQTVELRMRTEPVGNSDYDYVFIADPVLYTPVKNPPRIVLLLIDTLRADALGLYGAPRPTSPHIDAWSADAAVFTSARTIAPWTLPSVRALVSGAPPEAWGAVEDLPRRLGAAGWYTGMFAGNIYLSSNFDMADGWTEHRCTNWPSADTQVAEAAAALTRWPDRPAFVVVHFMDAHLPYHEPEPWRSRFAGEPPARFSRREFHRNDVLQAEHRLTDDERAWIRARYDNNVAYIDHSVDALLDALPADATVILTADHGEEFWEHGAFEHGHALHEELLRIPMIVKGPGIPAIHSEAPTSLLDVAPTVLTAAGLSAADLPGLPLQSVATAPPAPRPLIVGRPLYGNRRWGVYTDGEKYTLHAHDERVTTLATDPDEQALRVPGDPDPWRSRLAAGLGRPVGPALRIAPASVLLHNDLVITVRAPGGIAWAEHSDDPTRMSVHEATVTGDTATLRWSGSSRAAAEGWVLPRLGWGAEDIEITVVNGENPPLQHKLSAAQLAAPNARPLAPLRALVGADPKGPRIVLGLVPTPAPAAAAQATPGLNEEVRGELEALGYVQPEAAAPEAGDP